MIASVASIPMRRFYACAVLCLLLTFGSSGFSPAMAKDTHGKTQALVRHTKVKRVMAPAFRGQSTEATNSGRFATLIIDASTGEVLQQENADAPRRPASLTKMMTLYLTFQALDSGRLHLDSMLPVSSLAASQSPTKLDLRPGQRISTENAILGLVTESANDAAVVLAEAVGGDIDSFAVRMTKTAHTLGMASTNYQNPNGLPDPGQVTTARDQARLALALMRHFPRYYHYFSTPTFAYGGRMHPNHNHLMARYEGMDGIKTGFIRESGFNLVASCKRGNKRLIGVIFGGASAAGRDNQLAALLDAAFTRANGNTAELPRVQMAAATMPAESFRTQPSVASPSVNNAQAQPTAAQPEPSQPAPPQEVTSADADIVASVNTGGAAAPQAKLQLQPQAPTQMQPASPPTGAAQDQAQAATAYRPAPQAGILQLPSQQLAAAAPAPPARAEPKPARAAPSGGWGIQIGAYNDRASGQRATALVADSMPDLLQAASPRVLSVATGTGTIYRARLVGIDEKAARAACTRLQAKSRPCMTLPPGNPNGGANGWLASAGD